MILSHWTVPSLAVPGSMCIISPAFGVDSLTDQELNEIGAGGVNIPPEPSEDDHQLLSDNLLADISGKGVPGFVWPFQNVPIRLPGKCISWSSGDQIIDLGYAIYGFDPNRFPSEGIASPKSNSISSFP